MEKLLYLPSDIACFALDTTRADQWYDSFCNNSGAYHVFGMAVWAIAIYVALGVSEVFASRRRTPLRWCATTHLKFGKGAG